MDLFFARQPILDLSERVVGYELLFRDGPVSAFGKANPEVASSRLIAEGASPAGFDGYTNGQPAFVNLTRDLLLKGAVALLPPEHTVVEILESIAADPLVLDACRSLRKAGYRIALDDFTWAHRKSPLLEVADIVKVDLFGTTPRERADIAQLLDGRGLTLLAEKVETPEAFREARDAGYVLFQGYYFARPAMIASRSVSAVKLHHLEILRQVQRRELDFDAIEEVIKSDPSLTFRVLRVANSAHHAPQAGLRSVRQALLMMGEREFKRLILVVTLAGLSEDRPAELTAQAMVRALLCERLVEEVRRREWREEAFLTGMLSLMDAMVGRPLPELLREIPLAPLVSEALVEGRNPLGELLGYVVACERADWELARERAARILLDESKVPRVLAEVASLNQRWSQGARRAA